MSSRRSVVLVSLVLLVGVFLAGRLGSTREGPLRGVVLAVDRSTRTVLEQVVEGGATGVVLRLDSAREEDKEQVLEAVRRIRELELHLYYWIEVGCDEEIAVAHPELVASLCGQEQWRGRWPDAPRAGAGERLVAWPWVPILYEPAYELQLEKVERLLAGLPKPEGLFLDDLQGAPSACGCGNSRCRWTVDYLSQPTVAHSEPPVAARFLDAVAAAHPGVRIIPVWTGECPAGDDGPDRACHGAACADGCCWPEALVELQPVLERYATLGLAFTAEELARAEEREAAGLEAPGTIYVALVDELAKRRFPLDAGRLLPVLPAWEAPNLTQFSRRTHELAQRGIREWVLALSPLEHGLEPRLSSR